MVPGTPHPELMMASSSDAQGFTMARGRRCRGFNGIWETEKPQACGVEVYEREAARLAALCLSCTGSKGVVVPWSSTSPLWLAMPWQWCKAAGAEHHSWHLGYGQGSQSPPGCPLPLHGHAGSISTAPRGVHFHRGSTRTRSSEGPSTFPVPHKEDPKAAKLSAAFKKLLFSDPTNKSALGRPQRHETSLQAAGSPARTGATATAALVRAISWPPRQFWAGRCESPGRGEEELCLCTGEAARACALYKYLQPAFIFVI